MKARLGKCKDKKKRCKIYNVTTHSNRCVRNTVNRERELCVNKNCSSYIKVVTERKYLDEIIADNNLKWNSTISHKKIIMSAFGTLRNYASNETLKLVAALRFD